MEQMSIDVLFGIFGVAGVIASIVFGIIAFRRNQKEDIASDATMEATLKVDIDYIKRGIDGIRAEQHQMAEDISRLSERVTRVEESVKSAHSRLDEHMGVRPPKSGANCDMK